MSREIVISHDVCGGSPRIDGTRLTCANVVLDLTHLDGDAGSLISDHPNLNQEDLLCCLRYCSRRQCVEDGVVNFCQGCSLDTRKAEPCMQEGEEIEGYEVVVSEEHENDTVDVWKLAASLIQAWKESKHSLG